MSNVSILYTGNDNVLELSGLQNEVTGAYLDAATVTVTLVDAAAANVTGTTWPMTMNYVTGSQGDYRATLPYGLSLTAGAQYTARITANAGAGLRAEWQEECVARLRR